jgi:acetylornithine deacetylase/succinyl-diaminopimelate desuccinylase-like protein
MQNWKRWALAATLAATGGAWAQGPALDPQLAALAERETEAVLATLQALTAPDSGTLQAPGMLAVVETIEQFARALGGEPQRVTPASGVVGPNLVITFKGTGKRRIMLLAHMDTVYPAGTAAARPFRRDGNRAIAPGIADDKSGIAVFLHAMKLLHARGFQDYERVTMVFNSDEERGSAGSRDLIRSQAGAHDVILSGEPTAPEEGIVLATSGVGQMSVRVAMPGAFGGADARPIEELADAVLRSRGAQGMVAGTRMNWTIARAEDPRPVTQLVTGERQAATLTFRVQGRASHAGVNPDAGINAVVEVADLVRRTTEAAAALPGARLHWRAASGGLVGNIIPERGQAVAELSLPVGADLAAALGALAHKGTQNLLPGAQVTVETAAGLGYQPQGGGEAMASADMRLPDEAGFAALGKAARELLGRQKFAASRLTVEDRMGFPAYNASPEGRRLAELAAALYGKLGGSLVVVPRTYGGTDAVWAAQSGKPVVENMGLPGGNYHSSQEEFVLVDRIPRRVALVAEMIRALARP